MITMKKKDKGTMCRLKKWDQACSNMSKLTFLFKYITVEISNWVTGLKHHL